jgi:glycosyltransferase involved in cell wall biosynthesis
MAAENIANYSLLWLTENYFPNRGGMAESCDRISQQLRAEGWQVHIVHFASRKAESQHALCQGGSLTVIQFDENVEHSLQMAWLLLQQQGKRYTHVVAFGGFVPIFAAPLFAQWLALPLLTLLRGNDFDAAIFSPKRRDTLFYAFQNSAAIASVSSDKLEKIAPLFPHLALFHTPNGIDLTDWQPLPSNLRKATQWRQNNVENHKKVVGIFGHLKTKKGIYFFLSALAKTAAATAIHLLITGEIEAEETLIQLNETGISYTLLPFLDRHELLSYYPACDAVAIPSFYDGMPNVLLEAGGLGLPFIAADAAGMRDFLSDAQDGFLFASADLAACVRAINLFLQTPPDALKSMGQAAKQKVEQLYSHKQEAARYVEILKSIANPVR